MGTPVSDMQREFELKQNRTRDVYRRVGWLERDLYRHSNNSDPRDPLGAHVHARVSPDGLIDLIPQLACLQS